MFCCLQYNKDMEHALDLLISKQDDYENFYYFHWFYSKSVHYHSHNDYFEIILPLRADISQFFNNKTEFLNEKTVYIISPHYIHNIFCRYEAPKEDPHLFNLAISDEHFLRACMLISPSLQYVFTSNNGLTKIPLNDVQFSYILSLTEILKNCKPENRSTVITLLLQNLLVFLSLQTEEISGHTQSNYALDLKLRIDNLEFIDKNAKEIYAQYPIAFSALISQFKQLTGTTIIQYLIRRRMEYAKKLLSSTDYSVLEVSSALGYTSLSHFISVFRQEYGITPKAFQLESNTHIANYQTDTLRKERA